MDRSVATLSCCEALDLHTAVTTDVRVSVVFDDVIATFPTTSSSGFNFVVAAVEIVRVVRLLATALSVRTSHIVDHTITADRLVYFQFDSIAYC